MTDVKVTDVKVTGVQVTVAANFTEEADVKVTVAANFTEEGGGVPKRRRWTLNWPKTTTTNIMISERIYLSIKLKSSF